MRILILLLTILLLFCQNIYAQSLTVTWDDTSNNESGFRCERQTSGGSFFQVCDVGANVKTWRDANVLLDTPYCYRISAWNEAGVSAYSNTVCRTLTAEHPDVTLRLSCTHTPETGLTPVLAMGFNEGNGTTVRDTVGNNTGTISGATWIPNGKYGKALSFDGINDVVTIPDATALDLTTGMTLEAWVYPTEGTDWRTVMLKEQPGDLVYSLYTSGSTQRPTSVAYIGTTKRYITSGAAFPLNLWSFLAATYDGSLYRLYVNGVQVTSSPITGTLVASDGVLRIGGNMIWGEYFKGRIDEVRIYNRPLTVAEIKADQIQGVP